MENLRPILLFPATLFPPLEPAPFTPNRFGSAFKGNHVEEVTEKPPPLVLWEV
jgi:hypothetical protein